MTNESNLTEEEFIEKALAGLDDEAKRRVRAALNDVELMKQVKESARLLAAGEKGIPLSELKRRSKIV